MKKLNDGFTLIEVLVAIVLLAIISTGILSALVGQYKLLNYTKTITEQAFLTQEFIEKEIEQAKALLSDGDDTTNPLDKQDYTVFTRLDGSAITVSAFVIESSDTFNIHTIVAETRTPAFVVPTVSLVDLNLYDDNILLTKNYEYEAFDKLSLKALVTEDKNGVFLTNKHEWYVSRHGFNIPMIDVDNIDKDFDYGRLYPLFPNDYIAVPIKVETNTSVSSILDTLSTDYAGRHIIYAVTPYAVSGKRGDTYFSQPVFLAGLPLLNNLELHLDASLINKEDTTCVLASGDDIFLHKWIDLSGNGNDVIQSSIANRPELNEVQYQEDVYSWGKSTSTTKNDISMYRTQSLIQDQSSFTFIIVMKSGADEASPGSHVLLVGEDANPMRWKFGWVADTINPSKSNLAFSLGASEVVIPDQYALDNKWHIFTGIASGGKIKLRVDGLDIDPLGVDFTHSAKMNKIDISWNNIDNKSKAEIAEIMIYKDDLAGSDLTEVESYLSNKYNLDPSTFQMYILNLVPIPMKTIHKDTGFVMPSTVTANMSNGTQMSIPVNWSTVIDTSTSGYKSSVGTAVVGNTMTINLNVNVFEIDNLKPMDPIVIHELDDYVLANQLPAELNSSGSSYEDDIDVIWSVSSTIGLSVGDHMLTATSVDDNTKTMTMLVTVK